MPEPTRKGRVSRGESFQEIAELTTNKLNEDHRQQKKVEEKEEREAEILKEEIKKSDLKQRETTADTMKEEIDLGKKIKVKQTNQPDAPLIDIVDHSKIKPAN